jgi:hypothetical protein
VTVQTTPTLTVNSPTICGGSSTILTATPSLSGGTYLWTPGGAITQSITVNPTSTATYTVVYTLNGCSSNTATSTVTVNPTPVVTVNSTTICTGSSATLTATPSVGGGTYLWSPGGEITQSITVSPGSTIPYSVNYTLNGCSSASSSGIVTVQPYPTLSVNNSTICSGSAATLTATPSLSGGTYLWSPGGEVTQSIIVSPTSDATYTCVYTLNSCQSNTATANVTVNPSPIATITGTDFTICNGESEPLSALGFPSGGTFLWSPTNETTADILAAPNVSMTYSVEYTLNGCSDDYSVFITVQDPIITVSQNQNILTADQAGATYQWLDCTNGNLIVSGETSQTYTALVNGDYAVQVTLNGCTDTSLCMTVNTNSLDENSAHGTLVLSPNPTTDFLIIELQDVKNGSSLEMTDGTGKILMVLTIDSDVIQMNMKDLAPGVYYFRSIEIDRVYRIVKM